MGVPWRSVTWAFRDTTSGCIPRLHWRRSPPKNRISLRHGRAEPTTLGARKGAGNHSPERIEPPGVLLRSSLGSTYRGPTPGRTPRRRFVAGVSVPALAGGAVCGRLKPGLQPADSWKSHATVAMSADLAPSPRRRVAWRVPRPVRHPARLRRFNSLTRTPPTKGSVSTAPRPTTCSSGS